MLSSMNLENCFKTVTNCHVPSRIQLHVVQILDLTIAIFFKKKIYDAAFKCQFLIAAYNPLEIVK